MMGTLATIVSALGGAGAILAGLVRVASAIFKVIAESKELRKVVSANTDATSALTSQTTSLASVVADHEKRITYLEGAPHA